MLHRHSFYSKIPNLIFYVTYQNACPRHSRETTTQFAYNALGILTKGVNAMPFPRMIYRLMMLLAITFILGQFLPIQQATAKENNPSSTTVANTIYLPSLSNPNNSIFGSYLYPVNNSRGLDKISDARLNWTRIELNWKTIEPIYGNIDWKLAAGFDATISTALNAGLNPIVIIGDTPAWALKPGFSCGPIRQDYFPEFARFVTQAVQRYSSPPYNVYHYEMYNEPDASGFLGCWGDPADTSYYGGSYYGLMLQSIYPAAKSANPQSKILFGGLLLDCDPTNPPTGETCIPAKFLEGALQNGAANSFDGVAFHSYDYYQSFGNYSNPNWNSSRTATGPAFLSKAAYLRGVLQRYGISNKPLYMTEFALFDGGSGQNPSTPQVEATKSYF